MAGAAFVLLALLLSSRASAAAPTSFSVDVVLSEEGCPSVSALAESVNRLTGLPVSQRDDAAHFRVAFTRGPDGYEAQVRAPSGARRVLDAQRCEQLLSAVAAVVALTLDPLPEDPTAAPEEVPPPPPVIPKSAARPTGRRVVPVAVSVHAWGTYGLGPAPAMGGGADGELAPTPWSSVGVGVAGLAPQTLELGHGRMSHALVAAHAGGCLYEVRGALSVGPCLDALAGARFVRGLDATHTRSATVSMLAFGAGGRLLARLSIPLSLDVQVGALVPVRRDRFVIAGESVSEVAGTVALSARVGFRYVFR